MSNIKALLIDLDGTIYQDGEIYSGILETLNQLNNSSIPYRFITNSTRKTKNEIIHTLSAMNINIESNHIFTALHASIEYCHQHNYQKIQLLVKDENLKNEFQAFDIQSKKVDAVVIGDMGYGFDYALLNDAFNYVMEGADIIAMHYNRYWKKDDIYRLDIGPFVKALEFATGKSAQIVGKPSGNFFHLASSDWNLPNHQIAMIGDDIDTDIGGAQHVGLICVLVKTGKYLPQIAQNSDIKPDFIINSFSDVFSVL